MKKFIKIACLIVAFIFQNNLVACQEEAKVENKPTFIQELTRTNLQSFKCEPHSWSANTMEEYLKKMTHHRLNPRPIDTRDLAFNIFREVEKKELEILKEQNKIIGEIFDRTLWKDLDLFCGSAPEVKYTANEINKTNTQLGTISFFDLLAKPIYNLKKIEKRQEVVKTLLKSPKLMETLDQTFSNLEIPIHLATGFYYNDHFYHSVEHWSMFNLPGFKFLNKSEPALLARSFVGHTERINSIYLTILATTALACYATKCATGFNVIPEKIRHSFDIRKEEGYWENTGPVLRWLCKIDQRWVHAFVLALGSIYCGLELKNSITGFKNGFLLEKTIHTFSIQLAQFINACQNAYEIIKTNPVLNNFEEFKDFTSFLKKKLLNRRI